MTAVSGGSGGIYQPTTIGESDLYAELGIARNAGRAAIRRAYRKAAKATHPDTTGGSREAFDRAQTALRVLLDPRARATYDKTGRVDEPEPDNALAGALGLLAELIEAATGDKDGRLLERMRDVLAKARNGMLADLVAARKQRERYAALLGRFSVPEGAPNVFEAAIKGQMDVLDRQLAAADEKLKLTAVVEAWLAGATFR